MMLKIIDEKKGKEKKSDQNAIYVQQINIGQKKNRVR